MTQQLPLSRIESLKIWQVEQQQRLLEQLSQQSKFLSNEHKRMYEALGIQRLDVNESTFPDSDNTCKRHEHEIFSTNEQNFEYFNEDLDDSMDNIGERNQINIDEVPIKSSKKNFTKLFEEKLKVDTQILNASMKPKQKFLKKGAGLGRFRMTLNDLAHKKPKPILPSSNRRGLHSAKVPVKNRSEEKPKSSVESRSNRYSDCSIPTQYKEEIKNNCHNEVVKPEPYKGEIANNCHNEVVKPEPLVVSSKSIIVNKKPNFSVQHLLKQDSPAKIKYSEPKITWTSVSEKKSTDYQALLAELIEVRQQNPTLFDSPVINKSSETEQQIFERGLADELKLFEALEQKASNSSFSSTSSLVTQLMEHPIKSTPRKQLDFTLLTQGIPEDQAVEVKKLCTSDSSPRKVVSFSDQPEQYEAAIEVDSDEETIISIDCESSDDSDSSINSDDVCDRNTIVPTKYKNQTPIVHKNKEPKKIFKDAAINTDQPLLNSELLKTRLQQLETELDIFRKENARINKLKTQLETNNRNYEKKKRQLENDIEEQRRQIKTQLDEEKAKLGKDRAVYDRYAREIKEGKSVRQKEREELNLLRSKVISLEEEMKLKESKWAATQARIRSQLKHLEKENAILRTDNNELRIKNGKLEASNKQLLSRRPTDTKVLHEINKNLTRLAQEAKDKPEPNEKRKSLEKVDFKQRRGQSINRPRKISESKENERQSLNSTNGSKSSKDRSFESVEREYEKLFGSNQEIEENGFLPAAEASSCSDMSGRREEIKLEDGTIKITYSNGNIRTISPDGQMMVMQYHNGDLKETCKETGTVRYLHAETKTWQTTYPDGLELLEFANGQVEKRFVNGASEIIFPNGCRRSTSPGGTEEVTFPDGTLLLTRNSNGEKVLTLPNGQREIHTQDHKRREYPDGTVKLLYPDGVQETRYANGRIRLKDKEGHLIMDSAAV